MRDNTKEFDDQTTQEFEAGWMPHKNTFNPEKDLHTVNEVLISDNRRNKAEPYEAWHVVQQNQGGGF